MSQSDGVLVSILCLTYNHEKYISQAIDGFLSQMTRFHFEILVHDDASTDKTADIIREYAKQHPAVIRPILQDDNLFSREGFIGITKTLLNQASGKYIAFCEGDDYWHDPLKLQKQVDAIEADEDISLVTSDADVIHQRTGRLVKSVFHRTGNVPKPDADITFDLLTRKYIFVTATFLMRLSDFRRIIDECPYEFSDRWPFNDTQLMLECSRLGRINFIPESLATYRKLEESASSSHNPEHHARNIVALLDCTEHYARKFGYGPEVANVSRASMIGALASIVAGSKHEETRLQLLSLIDQFPFPVSGLFSWLIFWTLQTNRRMKVFGTTCLRLIQIRRFICKIYNRFLKPD
jgi:glycosyltransferase involved in cell wall biosynthesis